MDKYFVANGFPMPEERVTAMRRSGQKLTARLGHKPDATFRDGCNMHWLTDDDKFADIACDPIVRWCRSDFDA